MFRQLAQWFAEAERASAAAANQAIPSTEELNRVGVERVFALHPEQLMRFLEEAWTFAGGGTKAALPDSALPPALLSGVIPGLESGVRDLLPAVATTFYAPVLPRAAVPVQLGQGARWDHLAYAYLVENTRVLEILRRVVREYRTGERLEVPSATGHRWLRITEDLLFRPAGSGSIMAVTSEVRPDAGAVRRNAYHRLLGMDLNHGADGDRPYPYPRSTIANDGFAMLLEDLLREIWIASENFPNTSGSNPTDNAAIAAHARDLGDMLRTRRQSGNLAREEFVAVAQMAWCHVLIESDNAVVADLKSIAGSPEERLRKIGERVGLAPHARAENFLALAPKLSPLLLKIEEGDYDDSDAVGALYANPSSGPPNDLRRDVMDIINQWSAATGKDLKVRRPVTLVSGPPAPRPAADGRRSGGAPVGV